MKTDQTWEKAKTLFGTLAFVFIVVLVSYNSYSDLDRRGWIPHDRTVDFYMSGEWLEGENRICDGVEYPMNNEPLDTRALFCPGDTRDVPGHNIKITFWGKTSRPDLLKGRLEDMRNAHWRCTRDHDGFSCYAID
jgi:hypothetical protein